MLHWFVALRTTGFSQQLLCRSKSAMPKHKNITNEHYTTLYILISIKWCLVTVSKIKYKLSSKIWINTTTKYWMKRFLTKPLGTVYSTIELYQRFTWVSLPAEEVRGALSGPQCGQEDQIKATPSHFTLVTHLVFWSVSTTAYGLPVYSVRSMHA